MVSRLGFEPRTPALKGQCSTVELPARLVIARGHQLRSRPGQLSRRSQESRTESLLTKLQHSAAFVNPQLEIERSALRYPNLATSFSR